MICNFDSRSWLAGPAKACIHWLVCALVSFINFYDDILLHFNTYAYKMLFRNKRMYPFQMYWYDICMFLFKIYCTLYLNKILFKLNCFYMYNNCSYEISQINSYWHQQFFQFLTKFEILKFSFIFIKIIYYIYSVQSLSLKIKWFLKFSFWWTINQINFHVWQI